jgi:hypothetical protein
MDYGSLMISCLNLTSLFALFVFLLCKLTSGGAFTIDSSTLMGNLNEHPTMKVIRQSKQISFAPEHQEN